MIGNLYLIADEMQATRDAPRSGAPLFLDSLLLGRKRVQHLRDRLLLIRKRCVDRRLRGSGSGVGEGLFGGRAGVEMGFYCGVGSAIDDAAVDLLFDGGAVPVFADQQFLGGFGGPWRRRAAWRGDWRPACR